jgi:hypothetical protein
VSVLPTTRLFASFTTVWFAFRMSSQRPWSPVELLRDLGQRIALDHDVGLGRRRRGGRRRDRRLYGGGLARAQRNRAGRPGTRGLELEAGPQPCILGGELACFILGLPYLGLKGRYLCRGCGLDLQGGDGRLRCIELLAEGEVVRVGLVQRRLQLGVLILEERVAPQGRRQLVLHVAQLRRARVRGGRGRGGRLGRRQARLEVGILLPRGSQLVGELLVVRAERREVAWCRGRGRGIFCGAKKTRGGKGGRPRAVH